MDYVRIPASRIGAVIGPKGRTKRKLEEISGCKLTIDSAEGLVEIKQKNNVVILMIRKMQVL